MNTDRGKPSIRALLVYTFSAQTIMRMPLPLFWFLIFYWTMPVHG
jgi:hypothetical protein